jgi:uncharacterized repeat protein (TIGR01451 family)
MPLEELNKELNNPNDPTLAHHVHERSDYDPWTAKAKMEKSPEVTVFKEEKWNGVEKGLKPQQKRNLKIAIGVVAGVIIISLIMMGIGWWQKNAFHQERVSVSFEGPAQVDNTQNAKYTIHYKNDNFVSLKNVEIDLQYSENFQPSPNDNANFKILSSTTSKFFVPDMKAKSEGSVDLSGIFYAPQGYPVLLQANMLYVPSNQSSQLSNSAQIGVVVTQSPVTLEVEAPQSVAGGDTVSYVINYKNLDAGRLSNMQIRVDFPQGFEFGDSQPQPSEKGSYWNLGDLDSGEGGQINIQGKLQGGSGDTKTITVSMGHADQDDQFTLYDKGDAITRMNASILSISQSLSGNTTGIVNSGQNLNYVISYRNNGNIGLRDVIVTEQLQGSILDLSKLDLGKGSFDDATDIATWKASDIPALAIVNPGQSGVINFSVPVKQIIPVSGPNDKNFEIISVAKIDSPDIPSPINSNKIISSNDLDLKLASKVLFDSKAYFKDSIIANNGPIPIQVGKETTFTVHWSITSVSNDLSAAKVLSSLPSGVQWKGVFNPQGEKISFNPRTNQLEWDAGNIAAGTGITSPVKTVAFQVGVTPQSNQLGGPVPLINASVLTATDMFVSQDVNIQAEGKNTELSEDPSVGYVGGHVVAQQ